eukprot:gene57533-biopygen9454
MVRPILMDSHTISKDSHCTDLEKALTAVFAQGCSQALAVGQYAGVQRLDHTFGIANTLCLNEKQVVVAGDDASLQVFPGGIPYGECAPRPTIPISRGSSDSTSSKLPFQISVITIPHRVPRGLHFPFYPTWNMNHFPGLRKRAPFLPIARPPRPSPTPSIAPFRRDDAHSRRVVRRCPS